MKARRTTTGLRSLATLEAAKGLLVLAAGLGLLRLAHRDVRQAAEAMVHHLHLPVRVGDAFVLAASRLDDASLVRAALVAFAYAALRLLEAYGLWRLRPWAQWMAIVSAAVYLPFEAYELLHRPTAVHAILLATNVGIVVGLLRVRLGSRSGAA